MMLEIGQRYFTRIGDIAFITSQEEDNTYKGVLFFGEGAKLCQWHSDGTLADATPNQANDLVSLLPPLHDKK